MRWVQLCGSLSILWHCFSLGLEWKLTFSSLWPHPSSENWIKDLLSMAPPIRTRPVSPSVSLSHQEASLSLLPSPSEGRQTENHNHRKLTSLITWTTALSNSVKLSHAVRVGPPKTDGSPWRVLTMWSTGEGSGKPLKHSCLENPMNSMKWQKDVTLKEELPRT